MGKKINIQLLRVLACLGVFVVHFGQRIHLTGNLKSLTDFGRYGVHLFFIISGYLAFQSLCNANNKCDLITYYKKRIIRLLPLYYLIICYYFFTETFIWGNIPADNYGLSWFRYIFMLNGFVGSDTYFWANLGITWTIPIFAFFYLIAPFLAKIIKKLWQAVLCFLVAYALSFICNSYINAGKSSYLGPNLNSIMNLQYFILGIIVYFACKEHKEIPVAIVMSVVAVFYNVFIRQDKVFVLLFAIIFVLSNLISFDRLPNFIRKTIDIADEYSYSLYLGHGIVFCGLIDKISFSRPIVILIALIGTAVLTFILRNFAEKPLQKLMHKVLLDKHFKASD